MNRIMCLFVILLHGFGAFASSVAVIDSGTDFSHQLLQNRALVNENEIADNRVDDDANGKVDDVWGWNIVENYGKVFAPAHLQWIDSLTYRLFDIIARIQEGTASEKDREFFEDNFQNLPDKRRKKVAGQLNFFGQYAHGTHVSGVVALQSPSAEILALRVFPDTPPEILNSFGPLAQAQGVKDVIYGLLATLTNGTFHQASDYLLEREIDIANMSLGVPLAALAEQFLKLTGNQNPTPEQIQKETKKLFEQYRGHAKEWMANSPDTLFVLAAGNDGQNNDRLPTFPAAVSAPNKITVAASHGQNSLAEFSNFGKNSVEVAAPGVAIRSSVPHLNRERMMGMSGTSMAAPYVSGVAAAVKAEAPALRPQQVKTILMKTVDKKDWLEGRVASSGLVNAERALRAAELSHDVSLSAAIREARRQVADQQASFTGLGC